jgi:hypothetical protein
MQARVRHRAHGGVTPQASPCRRSWPCSLGHTWAARLQNQPVTSGHHRHRATGQPANQYSGKAGAGIRRNQRIVDLVCATAAPGGAGRPGRADARLHVLRPRSSAVEIAASPSGVDLRPELPLQLHQTPDPGAVSTDIGLDLGGRLLDGGEVDADQLRASLQRRRGRPAQRRRPKWLRADSSGRHGRPWPPSPGRCGVVATELAAESAGRTTLRRGSQDLASAGPTMRGAGREPCQHSAPSCRAGAARQPLRR